MGSTPKTFLPQRPAALTQLGVALHVCGVSLRYARTPQDQGKIERQHRYWQGRLPALFAAEASTTPESANWLLPDLRRRARCPTRPAQRPAPGPALPRWPYIWSRRTLLKVGSDGRVPIAHERLRVGASAGTRVSHSRQPNGTISILAHVPKAGKRLALLS